MSTTSILAASASETEPLLSSNHEPETEPVWNRNRTPGRRTASPYWVIPIVLVVNIARGMTLSPRIKVYNEIACRAVGSVNPQETFLTLLVADGCHSPEVQARASKIQASIITIMSVLSCGSTGLWSQWGDVQGRKFIFCVSIVGFIIMELVFILVSGSISAITRRGELFILVGPVFEGICGGLSVFNGVFHAYISDCTPDGSRSRIFAAIQGMVFVGLAFGPWIAGIVLANTDLGPYSLFYISIAIQLVLLAYVIFFLPESIRSKGPPPQLDLEPTPPRTEKKSLVELIKKLTIAFFSPITIFKPRTVDDGVSSRKDYSLTLLGSALFLYLLSTAVYQLKYLYGQHTYRWDSVQLGYYMSLLWISRATNLLILLPFIVSYFKPKTPITGATTPESIALELQFDKRLARASLSVDALGNLLIVIAPTSSQISFIAASCLSSFTSGGNPALHSLGAVCLQALGHSSETGRLFGAVGVLNAIAHSVAPGMYAATYGRTVSTYPKTIFCLAATLLSSSVILLGSIRTKARR
ncbi:major facilitator superfamily domain-containing protein [Mycena albidolilacea]|uniref:Major facilitator superfamily domain-containing protein n=1 Tax=Mycena albidolilacea TaxID=1033008 RepID=A0AAD7F1X8_9AGAR|nr:major facilitator superfamily domain-containing protein [Mycena albidolilacea]